MKNNAGGNSRNEEGEPSDRIDVKSFKLNLDELTVQGVNQAMEPVYSDNPKLKSAKTKYLDCILHDLYFGLWEKNEQEESKLELQPRDNREAELFHEINDDFWDEE